MTEDRQRVEKVCITNIEQFLKNTAVEFLSDELLSRAIDKGFDRCWISWAEGYDHGWFQLMGSRLETDTEMENRQWLAKEADRRKAQAEKKKLAKDKKLYNELKKRFG